MNQQESPAMESATLFVDFMYAITVGASLPRLDERTLDIGNPLFWAMLFMISVFLEDFYLYHKKVAPLLKGLPGWRGFILTMSIIGSWYVSQAAFPTRLNWFLWSFCVFFLLKLLGGLFMKPTQYPTRHDYLFLIPAVAAAALAILSAIPCIQIGPFLMLVALVPAWLFAVIVWWRISKSA